MFPGTATPWGYPDQSGNTQSWLNSPVTWLLLGLAVLALATTGGGSKK